MTQLSEDGQCLKPAPACSLLAAAGMVGVREVGEDHGFAAAVAEFPHDGERTVVTGGGFAVVSEVMPAGTVTCVGLAGLVPGGLVQVQGTAGGAQRVGVAAPAL